MKYECCPYCGSMNLAFTQSDEDEWSDDYVSRTFKVLCSRCGEIFYIIETYELAGWEAWDEPDANLLDSSYTPPPPRSNSLKAKRTPFKRR